jgi:hypothetical protein
MIGLCFGKIYISSRKTKSGRFDIIISKPKVCITQIATPPNTLELNPDFASQPA